MPMTDLDVFIRTFLAVFGILVTVTSIYVYFNPQKYWKITQAGLKFKGISGAKPSKQYYLWVRTSAIVQIVVGILSVALFILLMIKQ